MIGWLVKLLSGIHNNELAPKLVGHLLAGRIKEEEKKRVIDMTKSLVYVTICFSPELFYLFIICVYMCLCVINCPCVYFIWDYWIFGLKWYFRHF